MESSGWILPYKGNVETPAAYGQTAAASCRYVLARERCHRVVAYQLYRENQKAPAGVGKLYVSAVPVEELETKFLLQRRDDPAHCGLRDPAFFSGF